MTAEKPVPLSVIVPFYDETAFVDMAIGSVLGQGIAGLELILVNDNPDRFGADYFNSLSLPPAVKVIHQPRNSGLSAARNAGLDCARGDHIAFLDADDYYVAGGLAAHLEFARQSRADLTHAQTYLSRIGSPQISVLPRDAKLFGDTKIRKGLRDCENAQFITSSWSSLYRRDFLTRAGLRFDPEQVKFEDRLFVLSAVTTARSIAQLGQPVRVWRRRAGSISTSAPDPKIHLLQVQLLEKCMAVMANWVTTANAPPRFMKRETYNTLARLIWDIDVIPRIAGATDPFYINLGQRLTRVMQMDGLGHAVFDDPLITAIDRVATRTRKGFFSRRDFFEIQRAVKTGDYPAANDVLTQALPTVAAAKSPARATTRPPRLILHLGMHKTGSTALQRWFESSGPALADHHILFPKTGLPGPTYRPTRDGGLPGHQMLLSAINSGSEDIVWDELMHEIRMAGAKTVVLSCENFLMPLREDRADVMPRLLAQLGRFTDIQPIAFVRRPDVALDRLYREIVANGSRAGARSIDEFRVDYEPVLTDLPSLFAPFEAASGKKLRLIDYDAAQAGPGILPAFLTAAGADLPAVDATLSDPGQVYATLSRDLTQAARLLNTMLTSQDRREAALRDLFRTATPAQVKDEMFLSPADRVTVIDRFRLQSGAWAADRGYAPDYAAMQSQALAAPWSRMTGVSSDLHEAVIRSALRSETDSPAQPLPRRPTPQTPDTVSGSYAVTIRIRPWLGRALTRFNTWRGRG